ncbi:MAG TPA: RNA polymerase sigma factor [Paludibaculum sp.]|jgi:RNA polymerase sigma-70 factor (ECF subfamily)
MERNLEVALVCRLRAGDVAAFDETYEALNPRVFSFLCRMTRSRTVAEDLLGETWLRFVSVSGELCEDTRLVPWLFTVARNLYMSYCRSRAREQAYTSDMILLWPGELPRSPFELASINEYEQRLEAALADLPAAYREVLLLVGAEGLRPVDAAAVCGISVEACRQRLSRARALLSRRLADSARFEARAAKEVSL